MKLRFPPGVHLDLSKLILSGHSFGGMTCIETARNEPVRVKACLTFDPWLYCLMNEIKSSALKSTSQMGISEEDMLISPGGSQTTATYGSPYVLAQPFIAISSESFHPICEKWFESLATLKRLIEHCCRDPRIEHVVVKNTGHLNQVDMSAVTPLEVAVMTKTRPQLTTIETYLLMSKLWLSFLRRLNLNDPSLDWGSVNGTIDRMRDQWLIYDVKYEPS